MPALGDAQGFPGSWQEASAPVLHRTERVHPPLQPGLWVFWGCWGRDGVAEITHQPLLLVGFTCHLLLQASRASPLEVQGPCRSPRCSPPSAARFGIWGGLKTRAVNPNLGLCVNHSVVSNSLLPVDCSSPGSSVHGILQAKILEWLPFPPPGIGIESSLLLESCQPRDRIQVSCIIGEFFTI